MIRIALLSFILLTSFSCSSMKGREFPEKAGINISSQETQSYFDDIESLYQATENLRALARVSIIKGEDKQHLRYVMIVDRVNNRLRIEVLAPNSAFTLQVLVVDNNEATILSIPEKKAYKSTFSKNLLEKFLGIRANLQDLVALLTGTLYDGAYSLNREKVSGYRQSTDSMYFYSDDERLFFNYNTKEDALISFLKKDQFQDKTVLELDYSGELLVQERRYPKTIVMTLPQEDVIAQLSYRAFKTNSDMPEDLFMIDVPQDYELRILKD